MPQIDIATFWSIVQWSLFYFIIMLYLINVVRVLPFLNLVKYFTVFEYYYIIVSCMLAVIMDLNKVEPIEYAPLSIVVGTYVSLAACYLILRCLEEYSLKGPLHPLWGFCGLLLILAGIAYFFPNYLYWSFLEACLVQGLIIFLWEYP